ncbi:MAG: FMN-binding protein [Clostridiales Family XIII bacterium]|jgi:uncharacterized protein with FMN-binding domain|nr:FMN-binding protein [Clostridiales Family XIII bacterium]
MKKMNHMKRSKKIILLVLCVLIIAIVSGVIAVTAGLKDGAKLSINDVNLTAIDDGNYTGTYTKGRWTNTVVVDISDHKIKDIQIKKDVRVAAANVSEDMIQRVIAAQSLDVDSVSGATVTSKAYLKAIEIALN